MARIHRNHSLFKVRFAINGISLMDLICWQLAMMREGMWLALIVHVPGLDGRSTIVSDQRTFAVLVEESRSI